MKKSLYFVVAACTLVFSLNLHAMNIRVFFTNTTEQSFIPVAKIAYKKDNIEYEDQDIEPPISVIRPYAQKVPIDKERLGIENYYLIYFELFDTQHRYVEACLDSYLAITKSADIHFILEKDDEDETWLHCRREVTYR